MKTQIDAKVLVSFSLFVTGEIAFFATDNSASLGHVENQSIVQQFTNDGNIRQRYLHFKPNKKRCTQQLMINF